MAKSPTPAILAAIEAAKAKEALGAPADEEGLPPVALYRMVLPLLQTYFGSHGWQIERIDLARDSGVRDTVLFTIARIGLPTSRLVVPGH